MAEQSFTGRQNDIIEHALQLIAEQGIEKLTYRNLAKKLGITEPAFYRHFANKTEIMLGILVYFDGIRRDLFATIRASTSSSLAALESVFLRHFELFEQKPAFAMVLFPDVIRQNREELSAKVLEMMQTGRENIVAIITKGIERGEIRNDVDAEQLALMISGTLRLLVTRWQLGDCRADLQSQGRRFWKALSTMIRHEESPGENSEDSSERRETPEKAVETPQRGEGG